MIKDLFFDLDRTLWDFEKNSEAALQLLFDSYGLDQIFKSFTDFHASYKQINLELWELYRQHRIAKEELRIKRFTNTLEVVNVKDKNLVQKLADDYVYISPRQTKLFPGTLNTLKKLSEKEYRLHIITNGFKEVQYIKLANSGLQAFFDMVLCSEEVGKNKPHPAVFQTALSNAKAEANTAMMIGDDFATDIIGAQNVGMHAVLFDPELTQNEAKNTRRISKLPELIGLLD